MSCVVVCAAVAGGTLLAQGPRARQRRQVRANQRHGNEGVAHLSRIRRAPGPPGVHRRLWPCQVVRGPEFSSWGVKPLGDAGTYFESVRVRGYKVTRNSSVTVVAPNGTSTTFKHGDHVTFTLPVVRRRSPSPEPSSSATGRSDLKDRDLKDKLVIWMPNLAPAPAVDAAADAEEPRWRINTYRARAAIGFAATANPTEAERALAQAQELSRKRPTPCSRRKRKDQAAARGARGRGALTPPDFTTAQRVDGPAAPQFVADETFFNALFAGTPVDLPIKAKAEKGEPLSTVSLTATITINVDNTFETVSEQRTRNVVGLVEARTHAQISYVMFGAHLDHVGYSPTGMARCRPRRVAGREAKPRRPP